MPSINNPHFIPKKNKISQAIFSALISTPLFLSTAYAQEIKNNNEEVNEEAIEVMTVTAQKRIQNILKVPVSVSSVSSRLIEETGSTLLADVDKFIPGFEFGDAGMTQEGITMRGITSPGISIGGDPSSATFYDDIYMPRAAQNVLFSDIARIEVLKGPQGTLFGRNAAMGVVNMIPNAPREEFEGFVKATLGTDNLQRYEAMINIPLADNFYIRANGMSNRQDGYIENVATPLGNANEKVWGLGEKGHDAARIALLWDITDKTSWQLSYDWDKLDQASEVGVGVSEYAYNNGKDPFSDKAENDVRGGGEARDMTAITTKFTHEFSDAFSMKYVASYREWETVNSQEEDGTADITRYFDTLNNEDSDIFYTELQFNYVNSLINAVAGVSYSHEKVYQKTELNSTADAVARIMTGELNNIIYGGVVQQIAQQIGGTTDAHAAAAFGEGVTFDGAVDTFYAPQAMEHIWVPEDWANFLNLSGAMPGATAAMVSATGDLTYDAVAQGQGVANIFGPSFSGKFWEERIYNDGDFTNWGVFADVDFSITEKWNVITGLRYSSDKKDFSWYIPQTGFSAIRPGAFNILFPQANLAVSDEWSQTTGRFVTSYQLTDNHMVFGSYSTGYKSGGFDSLVPSQTAFEPEETNNLEIGYKGIISESLVANVSVYMMQLDNFQNVVDSKPPGNTQAIPTIINEDRTIEGLEVDLRWYMSESVTWGLVTEVRSTDIDSPDFYNGEGNLITATTTTTDAALNYTVSFDWMPDIGVGTTNFHVDYQFVENNNADQAGIEDYKLAVDAYFYDKKDLNARLSWENDSDTIEIGIWGKNLLDRRYVKTVGGYTATVFDTPAADVNRGIEMGLDFKYSF